MNCSDESPPLFQGDCAALPLQFKDVQDSGLDGYECHQVRTISRGQSAAGVRTLTAR